MEFVTYSHRNGEDIFNSNPELQAQWLEIEATLANITDDRIIDYFESHFSGSQKSLSHAINALIKQELTEFGWNPESPIFGESEYQSSRWRLDFAKGGAKGEHEGISVEVGFNHGGSVAWNLLKPVMASELNHVKKEIQTRAGIIIAATNELRDAGGFDGAIGTYEDYVHYLRPMYNVLTVPIVVIGLKAPRSFRIEHTKSGNKTIGSIKRF